MIEQLMVVPALAGLVLGTSLGILLPVVAILDRSISGIGRALLFFLGVALLFVGSSCRLYLLSIGINV